MVVIKKLIILVCAFIIVGCATVTGGGNSQSVSVNTVNEYGKTVDGASCNINNDKGNWKLTSPGQVTITKSNKAIIVRCEKTPSLPGTATVESSARGALFGNIIAGGLIGAAIDHSSGAGYEYPESINVFLGLNTGYKIQSDSRSNADKTPVVRMMPPPTGYAAIKDVDRLPIREAGALKGYSDYLNFAGPKAFAVSQDVATASAVGIMSPNNKDQQARDPGERALANCRRRAKTPCVLYAVDDQVVYAKPSFDPPQSIHATTPNTLPPMADTARTITPSVTAQTVAAVPSNFADINDINAIPYVDDRAREAYKDWLTRPTPRAFIISSTGYWNGTWGIRPQDASEPIDPGERALARCQARSKSACKLYAVNGAVVWVKEVQPVRGVDVMPDDGKPITKP